jgi:hypothetical protein
LDDLSTDEAWALQAETVIIRFAAAVVIGTSAGACADLNRCLL